MIGTLPCRPRCEGETARHNAAVTGIPIQWLDPIDRPTTERLVRLPRAAYRVEANLIGFQGIPQLHATADQLLTAGLTWIGAKIDGGVVAALAYRVEGEVCSIDRLVVDPGWFRRGLGSALVASLREHDLITVSTGTANLPACRLHEQLGSERAYDELIALGVSVTHFTRRRET